MGNVSEQRQWRYPLSSDSSKRLKLVDGVLPPQRVDGLLSLHDRYQLAAYVADTDWLATLAPHVPAQPHRDVFYASARHATLLLQFANTQVLIDPGSNTLIENANPSVIIVTHAHHDHAGDLLAAAQMYPQAFILMTPETLQLLQLLPYETAARVTQLVQERGQLIRADGVPQRVFDVEYRFLPAGHLVGAAMVDIKTDDVRVLVTGDFALRETGGLPGAVWSADAYDAVIMEASHAWDAQTPTADPNTNWQSLFAACHQAVTDGASRLIVFASALGEAQDAYIALCTAQMQGQFSEFKVRLMGKAEPVAKIYARLSSLTFSPWRNPIHGVSNSEHIPDHSIVIASGYENGEGVGAKLSDMFSDRQDTAFIRPAIGLSRSSTNYTYSISLHASFGELFATAAALNCRQVALYHGRGTTETASPLATLLDRIGRRVIHLTETPKSLGGI